MKDVIFEIIREACALNETINENTKINELSLDSLSFVEVIVKIEQLFDIEFDIEQAMLSCWETVKDIIHAVEEMVNEKK